MEKEKEKELVVFGIFYLKMKEGETKKKRSRKKIYK